MRRRARPYAAMTAPATAALTSLALAPATAPA